MNIIFKSIAILLVSILVGSCAYNHHKYTYSYDLVNKVESPAYDMVYADSNLTARFMIHTTAIYMRLKNRSDTVLKVMWDESVLIIDSIPKRILNSSVRYNDRGLPQVPTVIPENSRIETYLTPIENILWDSEYDDKGNDKGRWRVKELFPTNDLKKHNTMASIYENEGKEFTLHMPIEVDKKKKLYEFRFKITDINHVVY